MQDPTNTQNFNRYGYVLNNPLINIDPSGEILFAVLIPILVKAAVIGAGIGAAGYTISVALSPGGFNNFNGNDFIKSIAAGALSGAASAGVGQAFGAVGKIGHEIGHELLRTGAHGLSGGLTNLAFGGDFVQGFVMSSLGSLGASGMQEIGGGAVGTYITGAFFGGIGAELSGGEFWKGAATGAIIAGLNHLGNHALDDGPGPKSKSKSNFYKNVMDVEKMTLGWALGVGDDYKIFFNDRMANAMRTSPGVAIARNNFYNKGKTNYHHDFGLTGLLNAGLNPVQQFVGSYDVDVSINLGLGALQFTISNTTSFSSYSLHLWPSAWN